MDTHVIDTWIVSQSPGMNSPCLSLQLVTTLEGAKALDPNTMGEFCLSGN